MTKRSPLLLFISLGLLKTAVCQAPVPEQILYEDLMRGYQKAVRPVINASRPLVVKFALMLDQIVGLDERQQVLTTNVFIDQGWVDENLMWEPSNYSGIRSLRVAGSNVWTPDTFTFNNADDVSTGFMKGTFVQIHHDGSVRWPVPLKLRSSCKVDITHFPFDDQRCNLTFGSWIYSGLWIDFDTMYNDTPIIMKEYVNNSEWELLSVTLRKNLRQKARGPEIHPDLTFTLHIRRKTFYYIFNIIVPCIMLSILTLLTFWLPPTSGEKVTLGLSVFLAFSMFMLLIAEEVPATSEAVPLIGIYLCVVMTMTSVSVIMAVIVINIYNRGMKMRRAPSWIRTLALKWVSKVLRVKHDIELVAKHVVLEDHFYDVTKRPDHSSQIRKSYSKFDLSKPINSPIFTRHNNNTGNYQPMRTSLRNRRNSGGDHDQNQPSWPQHGDCDSVNGMKPSESGSFVQGGVNGIGDNTAHTCNMNPSDLPHGSESCQSSQSGRFSYTPTSTPYQYIANCHGYQNPANTFQNNSSSHLSASFQNPAVYQQGCQAAQPIRYEISEPYQEPEVETLVPHVKKIIVAEWQRIAVVVDRFLFWLYVIVTFTAYLIILIIIPAQHYTHGKRGVFQEGALKSTGQISGLMDY